MVTMSKLQYIDFIIHLYTEQNDYILYIITSKLKWQEQGWGEGGEKKLFEQWGRHVCNM